MKAAVSHAEAYPFEQPEHDVFCFSNGRAIESLEIHRRGHAVLAAGSNASPQQLRRKFGERTKPIAVEAVTVLDHVIVYSAHFARYGSIPATLATYPGATTKAYVTWLDDDDLMLMHETEALGVNYDYLAAGHVKVLDRQGKYLTIEGYYATRRGLLNLQGQPVRLAAMTSSGAMWPALTQRAALRSVACRLMPEMGYPQFMSQIIGDLQFRSYCTLQMGQWACS